MDVVIYLTGWFVEPILVTEVEMKVEPKKNPRDCTRIVVWHGEMELITVPGGHSYAWSGNIPCTGQQRCVFCNKLKDD